MTPYPALPMSAPREERPWWKEALYSDQSHLDKVPWVQGGAVRARCNAVVIPTSRDASTSTLSGVRLGAEIASAHGCPLVVILSKDAERPASVNRLCHMVEQVDPSLELMLVRLADVEPAVVLETHLSRLPTAAAGDEDAVSRYTSDVAQKRNAALVMALERAWTYVLFLDDDVSAWESTSSRPCSSTLDAAGLDVALSALAGGHHFAVAWAARAFSDNSVLCRLRRSTGQHQGVMIGGGALLVRLDETTPATYFPSIYNEDWLFLLALIAGVGDRAAVARAGKVRQDEPDVSVTVERALAEEFGDVLAEGLMTLARRPDQVFTLGCDPVFWEDALQERRQMIDDLALRLRQGRWVGDPASRAEACRTVEAVADLHERRAAGLSEIFSEYVGAWKCDLSRLEAHRRAFASRRDALSATPVIAAASSGREEAMSSLSRSVR